MDENIRKRCLKLNTQLSLLSGGSYRFLYLKANPYEGEKQAKCRKNEAIEFETPSEGGDPGTPQLDLKTLLLVAIATTGW